MDESFSSPKPSHSKKSLVCPCPPMPHKRKHSLTINDESIRVDPHFFRSSCSTISANDSNAMETNDEQAAFKRPAANFSLKRRPYNSREEPTSARKLTIKDFPPPPFSFPAPNHQTQSSFHPLHVRMPSLNSNTAKQSPLKRRRSSLVHIKITNNAFGARCA
mmetsp:Transcript_19426/g.40983  ORF Transcript_19426/g.40983 Transcript_19426/m.40983 type:complete len:162 (+) Transcript_19426:191-676(+)